MTVILPVTPAPPKFSNPFLADLAIPPHDAARGRFAQRFSWLEVLPQPKSEELADWGAYKMAVEEARSTTVRPALSRLLPLVPLTESSP